MTALLWLPPWRHAGALLAHAPMLRRRLTVATRLPDAVPGTRGLLETAFPELPAAVPTAALTRRIDAPSDRDGRWLRADPCHLRVEVAGVRMLACGALRIDDDEISGFEATLRPWFDEAGWRWHAASPERWYVQPDAAQPPLGGESPEDVLGAFIDHALPQGDAGRITRRWLNELQMALHDHPVNRTRRLRGLPEVNSLWLHGDGTAPASLSSRIAAVHSRDALLLGCANLSGVPVLADAGEPPASVLIDARDSNDDAASALHRVLRRREPSLMAFESGERFEWRPWHGLRFWRGDPV